MNTRARLAVGLASVWMVTSLACGDGDGDPTPVDPGNGSSGELPDADAGTTSSSGGSSSGGASSSSGGSSGAASSSGGSSSGEVPAVPWLVQCYYGAEIGSATASNPDIAAQCTAMSHTLVEDCREQPCDAGWGYLAAGAAYDALFAALDTNDDGKVDDADTVYRLALLGHSWGGTNLVDNAKKLADDDRVAASRKAVALAVAWDPFRPNYTLRVPANVASLYVLRQSGSPANDCSRSIPIIGPVKGLSPKCASGQHCNDHDYSLSPEQDFPTFRGTFIKGKNVEHCNTVDVGFPVANALLDAATLPPLPTSVPVTP